MKAGGFGVCSELAARFPVGEALCASAGLEGTSNQQKPKCPFALLGSLLAFPIACPASQPPSSAGQILKERTWWECSMAGYPSVGQS